jgi:hypothetical protein
MTAIGWRGGWLSTCIRCCSRNSSALKGLGWHWEGQASFQGSHAGGGGNALRRRRLPRRRGAARTPRIRGAAPHAQRARIRRRRPPEGAHPPTRPPTPAPARVPPTRHRELHARGGRLEGLHRLRGAVHLGVVRLGDVPGRGFGAVGREGGGLSTNTAAASGAPTAVGPQWGTQCCGHSMRCGAGLLSCER